jgi:hypothetical protein
MSLLSAATAHAPTSSRVKIVFQRSWFKGVMVFSFGVGTVLAIVMATFQMLQKQPAEAFSLLKSWGPWFLIAGLAMYLFTQLMSEGIQGVRESFKESTAAQLASAEAQGRTADALTRLADQGSRSADEIKRLTMYAAQEFPSIYGRFDRQDVELEKITSALIALGEKQTVPGRSQ